MSGEYIFTWEIPCGKCIKNDVCGLKNRLFSIIDDIEDLNDDEKRFKIVFTVYKCKYYHEKVFLQGYGG